ncbi:MAG: hypothetical protein HWQ38_14905 [Nostoc sp. NMS7]|uniref:hypothetical protein n=1 Tax=Nostoc sp. NMS7 TaxID=2815391 RepID=UPI0025D7155B|nr:hypothetical protein [Nostoc sp. NMS7]MBN3947670.1 hypothetical protein [Nostoc sp. NMS7]
MSNNQDIFQGLGLVEELDEQAGETITGGYEVFEVKNQTKYNVSYYLDGTKSPGYASKPYSGDAIWTAYSGGIIKFDADGRNGYTQYKTYNLANGGVYAFRDNNSTKGNPYDIELYKVG